MKTGIEWQVSSLELSKRLKELGVKQESVFKYCGGHTDYHDSDEGVFELCPNTDLLDDDEYCHTAEMTCEFTISAFTVAELGEMLPKNLPWTSITGYLQRSWSCEITNHREGADTEADARAKMLIYLLENNLLTL